MNAKARNARRILKDRVNTNRANARINRRGNASLTTHAIAAGLTPRDARTVATSLRRNATKLAITGTQHRTHAGRRMRTTTRYTPAQVAAICVVYRPRKPSYVLAVTKLALAA